MNTKQQLTLAWTVTAVFAVLLAIAGFFLANPTPKSQNITEKQDMVRENCSKNDQASRDACAQDLQDMSDMLREFGTTFNANNTVKVTQ